MVHGTIRILAIAVLLAAGAAQAQLRAIPPVAKRATMSPAGGMLVDVDGKRMQLAAGAQIRDDNNRIVVPTALPGGSLVRYQLDPQGMIWRVWILTPQEAAQPDPKP